MEFDIIYVLTAWSIVLIGALALLIGGVATAYGLLAICGYCIKKYMQYRKEFWYGSLFYLRYRARDRESIDTAYDLAVAEYEKRENLKQQGGG